MNVKMNEQINLEENFYRQSGNNHFRWCIVHLHFEEVQMRK